MENNLMRFGYRRLHQEQIADAKARTRRLTFDLADAVIALQTVTDEIEKAFEGVEGWLHDDDTE